VHNQIITTTIMKEEMLALVETLELEPEEMLETQELVDLHLHENDSRTNSDILQKIEIFIMFK
jgi:hypothetical protein